jgi:hypothetical protein
MAKLPLLGRRHYSTNVGSMPHFTCIICGKRGADVRPDFNWNAKLVGATGYGGSTNKKMPERFASP